MEKSFRKLDEMAVEAQFRARKIYEEFMECMTGNRAEIEEQIIMTEVQNAGSVPTRPNLQEEEL